MSLFNLAHILNTSTNKIQNMIDNTQMKVRLNMKLESDVDIIEKFLSSFKPKLRYICIYLPNKISENKLKKLLNSLAELNTKVKNVSVLWVLSILALCNEQYYSIKTFNVFVWKIKKD